MQKEGKNYGRDYYIFNHDNDLRTMLDNEVIGVPVSDVDLGGIFDTSDPKQTFHNIVDNNLKINQTNKKALERLIFDIEIGDAIALADKDDVYAVGIVESDYRFRRNDELASSRKVKWLSKDKFKMEDGNPRIKVRKITKEENHKLIDDIINNALGDGDHEVLVNYLSKITVEKYINFFKKNKFNPHEIEILNLIYRKGRQGLSFFELRKHFDGIDVEDSIETLARKISRRFNLTKINGTYLPNIFNTIIRDGQTYLVMKHDLEEALVKTNVVSKDYREGESNYTLSAALNNSVYSLKFFEEIYELLLAKRNINLVGPWGTGKSYFARKLSYLVMGNRNIDNVLNLKMHPSQTYQDLLFENHSRILYYFIERARKDLSTNYVVILEDCHEVDLNKVLGEVAYLIEDNNRTKDAAVDVVFDDKKFYLPKNIYVIKTYRDTEVNFSPTEISNTLIVDMKGIFNNRFINMFEDVQFGRWIAHTFKDVNSILEKYNLSFNHGLFLKRKRGITIKEYKVILNYKIMPILRRMNLSIDDYNKVISLITYDE